MLVPMDIAMKGMKGLQATAPVKTRFPAQRILMHTQNNDPELWAPSFCCRASFLTLLRQPHHK
jgi:DNA-binding NarL/FixJ family response regulator